MTSPSGQCCNGGSTINARGNLQPVHALGCLSCVGAAASTSVCASAAEKASIYTYPAAILPVLNPLMKALAYMFPDKGICTVSSPESKRHMEPAQDRLHFCQDGYIPTCSALAVSQEGAQALMLLLMQAIQARQVLRGTVAELVKETRKQEAEGALLAQPSL